MHQLDGRDFGLSPFFLPVLSWVVVWLMTVFGTQGGFPHWI